MNTQEQKPGVQPTGATHTPGPMIELSYQDGILTLPDGTAIKATLDQIAAAPELLEACRYIAEVVSTMPKGQRDSLPNDIPNAVGLIDAAIAKAQGGAV